MPPRATPALLAVAACAAATTPLSRGLDALPRPHHPTASPTPPATWRQRELDDVFAAIVEHEAAKYNASFSLAFQMGDQVSAAAAGVVDPAGTRAAVDDKYAWGSITKMATGASILKLVADGALALDDRMAPRVDSFLAKLSARPDWNETWSTVGELWGVANVSKTTIRDLLGMESSVPDFDTANNCHPSPCENTDPLRATLYVRRADYLSDESRRRRGRDADSPQRRGRGDAAAPSRIVRGGRTREGESVTGTHDPSTPPRPRRGQSAETRSRRRRRSEPDRPRSDARGRSVTGTQGPSTPPRPRRPWRPARRYETGVAYTPTELMAVPWVAGSWRGPCTPYHEGTAPFCYSSTGFMLLGMILADALNASSPEALDQNAFLPKDVATRISWANDGRPPSAYADVHGHDRTSYNQRAGRAGDHDDYDVPGVFAGWTASDIVADASAVADLAWNIYGTKTVTPNSDLMIPSNGGLGKDYEIYGLATFNLAGDTGQTGKWGDAYGHLGATYGYQSVVSYFPHLNASMAIATSLETDTQQHPSDALCLAYNKAVDVLYGVSHACNFTAGSYYSGDCDCDPIVV